MTEKINIVTISGLPGSGTSTTCDLLQERLGWHYVNSGQTFRQMAKEAGVSLADWGQRAEEDAQIDRAVDDRMMQQAQQHKGTILEGRITGWMVLQHPLPAFKVWLQAYPNVRAQRVGDREGQQADQALAAMEKHEQSEARRYTEHYGINIADLSIYDLVIDTALWSPEQIAEQIVVALQPIKEGFSK